MDAQQLFRTLSDCQWFQIFHWRTSAKRGLYWRSGRIGLLWSRSFHSCRFGRTSRKHRARWNESAL